MKRLAVNTVKNLLIILYNLLQVHLKLLLKKAIQKTAEVTGYLIRNKISDKIIMVSKSSPWNISKKILNMTEKYIEKDIYLKNKNGKLLII